MLSRIPIRLNETETVTSVLSADLCADTIYNSTNVTELAMALTGGTKQLHFCIIAFFLRNTCYV